MSLADADTFARALVALVPEAAVFVFDTDMRLRHADGAEVRRGGFAPAALIGRLVREVMAPDDWASLEPLYRRVLDGETIELDKLSGNGRVHRVHGTPVHDDGGGVTGGMMVVHEAVPPAEERLSERLRQQSAVAELGKMAVTGGVELDDLIEAAGRLVSETLRVDSVGVAELCGDELRVRMESSGNYSPGQRFPLAGSVAEVILDTRGPVAIDDTGASAAAISTGLRAAGMRSVASVPIGPVSEPFGMLGVFSRDIAAFSPQDVTFLESIAFVINEASQRRQSDAELRRQALHDPLTGLPNRTLLDDRLRQTLAVAKRAGFRAGVLFVDLDHFKVINDSLGHHAGDDALRAVAARLRSAVRSSDTVARFGGDEFVVVAAALEDENDLIRIATSILSLLDAPILVGEHQVYVRASIGVCFARPDEDPHPRALIADADAAMYRAKARGRGRYELAESADDGSLRGNPVTLEQDLRRALTAGDLRVVFQPFVSLTDGAAIGAEALLRWKHESRGHLGPADFLDVAENSGLIVPIGEWMLRVACEQAVRWAPGREFLITVNVSAGQLADPGIVAAVRRTLDESGLPPGCLGLELTEQVLVVDESDALRTLTHLEAVGVKLLLDDFGTGFSSLSHLKRFPIDVVKIDRSFIEDLGTPTGSDDAAIVAAIVGIGRATGKQVIPEGVETATQAAELRRLGCECAQGYHFARPLPATHFEDWFRTSPAGPEGHEDTAA